MTCENRRWAWCAWLALLVATPAFADRADDLFRRGRDLMKAGNYAEACAAFEESESLDPQDGTRFNLAQCREKLGKLAEALRLYRRIIREDENATRREAAQKLAAALEEKVPALHVHVEDPPDGTVVALDGVTCSVCLAGPVPVDLGRVTVKVSAPGHADVEKTVIVSEPKKTYEVTLVLSRVDTPIEEAPPPPPPSSGSSRKTWGIVTLALGGAGLATGGVFGYLAHNRWDDARAICGGDVICPNSADAMRAQELGDEARQRALISTIGFAAGGALVLTGILLVVTSPTERAVTVSATTSRDTAVVTVGGHF